LIKGNETEFELAGNSSKPTELTENWGQSEISLVSGEDIANRVRDYRGSHVDTNQVMLRTDIEEASQRSRL